MGQLEDKALSQILEQIFTFKLDRVTAEPIEGVEATSMTVDSPVPFSLKKLWFDLLDPEIRTWADQQRTVPAIDEAGDADILKAPRYKPHGPSGAAPFINQVGVLGIRRPLNQLRTRLLDRRYDFLLHPGPWEPNLSGHTDQDLPALLEYWLGHNKPITILDLSGIPSTVVARLIGAILRIIYDALFWSREKSEGGVARPLMIVMEEAHRYLSKDADGPARSMIQRVVKEGRKFGIGAMIVSQRPTEVDETILSQCGTFIALRLSNSSDRGKVQSLLSDNLAGVVESLPVLRTGEAIIVGEAARLPIRCRISLPGEPHRPNSGDPDVAKQWRNTRILENYTRVSASWRAQNPLWSAARVGRTNLSAEEIENMEREMVASSNVVSIGYDSGAETLEVEYKNEGIYQYYNVPEPLYQQLMSSDSKGKFLHAYIKHAYPFSRV